MMIKFTIIIVIVSVIYKVQGGTISSIETSDEKHHEKSRYPRSATCACQCGKRNELRGKDSGVNEFPWMAFLNPVECTASLINDRYVLTAKHCLASVKPPSLHHLSVTFHSHNRCNQNKTMQWKAVDRVINYAGSSEDIYLNDIALLRLREPVTISAISSPICLPKNDNNQYVGIKAIVAGWGGKVSGKPSCTLSNMEVPVIPTNDCQKYISDGMVWNSNLCAGYPKAVKKDACPGDSGGPLFKQRRDKSYEAIGIVSRGKSCGLSGYPVVYTSVSTFLGWIRENTQDACYCTD